MSPPPLQNPGDHTVRETLTKIVLRHAHDVRNHINGLEFDVALLDDGNLDSEGAGTLCRMRAHLSQLDATVGALLLKFDQPRPVAVAAGDLLQLWRLKVSRFAEPGQSIEWPADHESLPLIIDAKAVVSVLCGLTLAAWKRSSGQALRAALHTEAGAVVVGLKEPAHDLPLPLDLISESALFIQANGGRLEHRQALETGEWLTTLTFAGGGRSLVGVDPGR